MPTFEEYLPQLEETMDQLAKSYSRKYNGRFSIAELKQEALIGLWKASNNYDTSKGTQFKTHAINNMHYQILHYITQSIKKYEVLYADLGPLVNKFSTKPVFIGNTELKKFDIKGLVKPRLQKYLEKRYGF